LEETAFIQVLFSGAVNKVTTGWLVDQRPDLWRPSTDVYETEDQVVVLVEIPGVQTQDVSITYFNRRLVIEGVRHDPNPHHRAYHQLEIHFGEFRVEVELPMAVAEDHIRAEYQSGLLCITLPKF